MRVAYALGLPCVTGVKAIAVEGATVRCEQEVAGGRDVYELTLPAVVTVKEGLNLPRYPSVPGRLRAKRKPLAASTPERERTADGDGAPAPARDGGQTGPGARPRRRRGARGAGHPARAGGGRVILVYVEDPADELSAQALTFARRLGEEVHAVLIGPGAPDQAAGLGAHGVRRAHVAEDPRLDAFAPAAWAQAIATLVARSQPTAVIAPGSDRGNEVLAHVAARLDEPLSANTTALTLGAPASVTRVRWGGSLLEEAQLDGTPLLATVAPHAVAAETDDRRTTGDRDLRPEPVATPI